MGIPGWPGSGGRCWIRTSEGVSQQIYSLPPLATWVTYHRNPAQKGARLSQTGSLGSRLNFGMIAAAPLHRAQKRPETGPKPERCSSFWGAHAPSRVPTRRPRRSVRARLTKPDGAVASSAPFGGRGARHCTRGVVRSPFQLNRSGEVRLPARLKSSSHRTFGRIKSPTPLF